jgi:hypothetical protein
MRRGLRVPIFVAVLGVLTLATPTLAWQLGQDRVVVMKSDGTLYFVQGGQRYHIVPLALPDEVIDAIPEAGATADLALSTPPAPEVIAVDSRVIVEPSATLGLDVTQPIPPGVICRCSADRRGRMSTFEISVDEVVRDAWPLVQRANRFNRAPNESLGYLALKISMRYFTGPADDAFMVSATDFKLVGADRELRNLASIIEPEPRLNGEIYPGALVSGYVVYEIRPNEPGLQLLWETNFTGERGVWFALG